MNKKQATIIFIFLWLSVHSQPTPQQLAWHNMEYYWFVHFGPNTFTGKEWGHGDEKEEVFAPTQLDCRQWCRIAKASGAKGIIITAKHHDGFCLWPSKYSTHTVRESRWRRGKGDVLKELSEACKEYGLKFGVYISPWDRNHPEYGTEAYNDVFENMMRELFTSYGPIWELWWDGANGEGPNGKKQVYDWQRYETFVRKISPQTIIFSDIGPDCRWVGNEKGLAGKTNWNYLDTAGFHRGEGAPPTDTLTVGNVNGKQWIPAECDVSIRPGWFYHKEEDDKVKTPEQLFALYLKSVGRGANLLLNIPPDSRGRINAHDSAALMGFKRLREESFKKNLIKQIHYGHKNITSVLSDHKPQTFITLKESIVTPIRITFNKVTKVNCIVLSEALQQGQQIESFKITIKGENGAMFQPAFTTMGRKRIISFSAIEGREVLITITAAKAAPLVSEIGVYLIDEKLTEK